MAYDANQWLTLHGQHESGDTTLATISECSTKFTSVESRFIVSLY